MLLTEFPVDFFFHIVVRTLYPKKCNFNAPAIRKEFLSKFDKYNILALS